MARTIAFACVAGSAACGDPDTGGTPSPPPPGGTTGTGLAWTQPAPNRQTVQQYRFLIYIDGTRSTLANAQCPTANNNGTFECSAPLPQMSAGRHLIALAAVDPAGIEGAMSTPVQIDITNRSTESTTESTSSNEEPAPEPLVPGRTCTVSPRADCFVTEILVSGLERPHSLVPLNDGRLLFIDQRARVMYLNPDGQVQRYDLPEVSGHTWQSLALDVDFEATRHIYAAVAITTEQTRALSVMRFREIAGTLGEAATIVPDIPMSPAREAALSIGADRHLYLALPAVNHGTDNEPGVLLRFDMTGAAKGSSIASPVLAETNSQPSKLAWHNRRLWLAGLEALTSPALSWLSPNFEAQLRPMRPLAVDIHADGGVRDVAPPGQRARDSSLLLVVDNPRSLVRADVEESGSLTSLASIPLGQLLPEAVAVSENGDIYVAAMTATDYPAVGFLLRLRAESNR